MKCFALGFVLISAATLASGCRTGGSNASLKSDDLGRPGVGEAATLIGTIQHRKGFNDFLRRESGGEISLVYATPDVAKAATQFAGVAHLEGSRADGSSFNVQSVRSASFPMTVKCRVTGGKEEDGKPAKPQTEFKLGFGEVNAPKGPSLNGDRGLIVDEADGAERGQVIFDFGVRAHGGDQYSAFYFQEKDVAALGAGKATTIPGKHETGFDFADGDHIALYDVECKSDGTTTSRDVPRGGEDESTLGAYRLVQPKSIKKQADGKYLVTYSAPCAETDFEGYVGHTDDSGDMSVHVGVAYPVRRCTPRTDDQAEGLFESVMLDDGASGKSPGDGGEFEPIRLGGGGFMAAPVQIKKHGDKLIATMVVPCSEIDFEAYVAAIDDSGNRDMAVAVVFARGDCQEGGPATVTREIEKDDPFYQYLGGDDQPINYVPMPITVVEPKK